MKTKTYALTILLICIVNFVFSQSITDIKTELKIDEIGKDLRLIVTPNTYDMTESTPTKKAGVYGLLVCYIYKDVQKALHVDCTGDFINKGFKELFLGASATESNISILNVSFYRRDLLEKSVYPKKTDCFE